VPEEVDILKQEVHTQMVALVDLEDLELISHHL
jgi:hypothetical protein